MYSKLSFNNMKIVKVNEITSFQELGKYYNIRLLRFANSRFIIVRLYLEFVILWEFFASRIKNYNDQHLFTFKDI